MSLGFETTPGRKGATSARREALDPINLVSRIMKKHPHAGVDEVCRRVRTALAGPDAEYQEAFDNYCTRNHFNLLYKDEHGGFVRRSHPARASAVTVTVEQRETAKAEAAKRAAPIIENIKRIVLMELPTPFGKPLGDLNEAEGCKLTGWQATVFAGIGKQKLRDARSEADLHKAFARVNC
jgi:hypothetical protein